MNNEIILSQLEEIEKKVESLIAVKISLEAEKTDLIKKNNELEAKLQGKVDAENKYADHKALIRSKIDGLLARLEDVADANS